MILLFDNNIDIRFKNSTDVVAFFRHIIDNRYIDENAFYCNNIMEGIKFSIVLQKLLKLERNGSLYILNSKLKYKDTIGGELELCIIEHEDNILNYMNIDTPLYSPIEYE